MNQEIIKLVESTTDDSILGKLIRELYIKHIKSIDKFTQFKMIRSGSNVTIVLKNGLVYRCIVNNDVDNKLFITNTINIGYEQIEKLTLNI